MDGGLVVVPGVPGFPPGASWTAAGGHGAGTTRFAGGLPCTMLHAVGLAAGAVDFRAAHQS